MKPNYSIQLLKKQLWPIETWNSEGSVKVLGTVVSGTKMLTASPLCPVHCEVGPPLIEMFVLNIPHMLDVAKSTTRTLSHVSKSIPMWQGTLSWSKCYWKIVLHLTMFRQVVHVTVTFTLTQGFPAEHCLEHYTAFPTFCLHTAHPAATSFPGEQCTHTQPSTWCNKNLIHQTRPTSPIAPWPSSFFGKHKYFLNLIPVTHSKRIQMGNKRLEKWWNAIKTPVWNIFTGSLVIVLWLEMKGTSLFTSKDRARFIDIQFLNVAILPSTIHNIIKGFRESKEIIAAKTKTNIEYHDLKSNRQH